MRDIAELLSAYFDDSLQAGELEQLRAWLAASPDNMRRFVRESVIHSRLRDVLLERDMQSVFFSGAFDDAVDPQRIASLLDEEEEVALRREQETTDARAARADDDPNGQALDRRLLRIDERRTPHWLVYAGIAAAAVLLVLATRPAPPLRPAGRPQPNPAAAEVTAQAIAAVADSFNSVLRRGEASFAVGDALTPGLVALERGVAELRFNSGVNVVIEAPAELELLTADRAKLVRGQAVVRVPEQALGFTLHSDAASFVDLGTEFGVEVAEHGVAQVHILDGEVALVSVKGGPSRTLQRGLASEVSADGSVTEIAFDEARFVRRVPQSAYELAVLKSRPLAYWRLDALEGNATPGSGRLALAALVGAGTEPIDVDRAGANGDGPVRAFMFSGEHDGLDVAAEALGLASNWTCEAWVLPDQATAGPQRVFSTFDRPRSGLALGVVDGRWNSFGDDDRRHLLLTVYGDYDCVARDPLIDGQWVHIAATVDASGAPTLYVDGITAGVRYRSIGDGAAAGADRTTWLDESPTPVGRATAGAAKIGRNPVGSDGGISPERWQGQISHVAVYDRVLNAAEIQSHFAATKETAPKRPAE
jgi:hypothetical protein